MNYRVTHTGTADPNQERGANSQVTRGNTITWGRSGVAAPKLTITNRSRHASNNILNRNHRGRSVIYGLYHADRQAAAQDA